MTILESLGNQAVFDANGNNLLSTKNKFCDAVYNDEIEISMNSWKNFIPVFDGINEILSVYTVNL